MCDCHARYHGIKIVFSNVTIKTINNIRECYMLRTITLKKIESRLQHHVQIISTMQNKCILSSFSVPILQKIRTRLNQINIKSPLKMILLLQMSYFQCMYLE